jgi:hypothetical protein
MLDISEVKNEKQEALDRDRNDRSYKKHQVDSA